MSEYDDSLNSFNYSLDRPPLFADYDPFPLDVYPPFDMPIKDVPPQPTSYIDPEPEETRRTLQVIHLSPHCESDYLLLKKGQKRQTMHLHAHFKSLLGSRLKDLVLLKVLTSQQVHACRVFLKSGPSFKSLETLVQNGGELRRRIGEWATDTALIREIMTNDLCMQQKLLMVKYLERFRLAVSKEGKHSWKPGAFDQFDEAMEEDNGLQ